ncbi:MAG: hypothetical protein IJP66_07725, partial [Kiritimatiellae bacterium]|nr:hypothetical protein [Kiritimatiellia bacterium]
TLAPVSSNGTSTITTTICGGGALRPGDEYRSGSLEVATDLTIADGGRLVVHVGSDANTCLRCTGSGCDFRVSGTAILRVETDGTLERGRSIKIADFSGASNPSYLTFVDPARWTFELPDGSPIHHPSLFVAEDALWLKFSVDTGENYKVLFW